MKKSTLIQQHKQPKAALRSRAMEGSWKQKNSQWHSHKGFTVTHQQSEHLDAALPTGTQLAPDPQLPHRREGASAQGTGEAEQGRGKQPGSTQKKKMSTMCKGDTKLCNAKSHVCSLWWAPAPGHFRARGLLLLHQSFVPLLFARQQINIRARLHTCPTREGNPVFPGKAVPWGVNCRPAVLAC